MNLIQVSIISTSRNPFVRSNQCWNVVGKLLGPKSKFRGKRFSSRSETLAGNSKTLAFDGFFEIRRNFSKGCEKRENLTKPEPIYIRMNIQAQFSAPLLRGRRIRRIAAMTSNLKGEFLKV